jgi:catechol 2,3-dioxygenase-like lactoylglutathione lyase family enzyme
MTAEIIPEQIKFGRIAATVEVTDMARALAFYVGVLGMTKVFENGDPVGFAILRKDAGELHVTLNKKHLAGPNAACHLMISDATALHEFCNRRGVRIVKGLRDQAYGLRDFVIADPDGNRIDIGQPLP